MPLVSIIIVNYNGKHFLKDCLSSIRASETPDEEVLVVDNASSDGSCEYLRTGFPWVKVIELDRNYGFAEANNIGAEAASGTYLAFLNNDTVVTPGWMRQLVDALTADESIGVAGSKLLLHDAPGRLNSAGANITFNGRGYDIGFGDPDRGQYDEAGPRGAVCAASMLVRRREFLSLGGFDSNYFMYFEDVDLCWRYWLGGYRVLYVPSSVVSHKFGGTSGSDRQTPLRVFYGLRNSMMNILKNYELRHVILPACFNILYAAAMIIASLVRLKPERAWAVVRALGSLAGHLAGVLRERNNVARRRKISDDYLFANHLIVSLPHTIKEYLRLRKRSHSPAS